MWPLLGGKPDANSVVSSKSAYWEGHLRGASLCPLWHTNLYRWPFANRAVSADLWGNGQNQKESKMEEATHITAMWHHPMLCNQMRSNDNKAFLFMSILSHTKTELPAAQIVRGHANQFTASLFCVRSLYMTSPVKVLHWPIKYEEAHIPGYVVLYFYTISIYLRSSWQNTSFSIW